VGEVREEEVFIVAGNVAGDTMVVHFDFENRKELQQGKAGTLQDSTLVWAAI